MSFAPIVTEHSRILIVGTWPSPKSREQGFYYGHPQNRFWPMLARILHAPVPQTIAEKIALIEQNGLALWDTVAACTITGASDASIRDVVPNDLAALCRRVPIRTILCNGTTAYKLYEKYIQKDLPAEIRVRKMPSTSPANAAWSMNNLCEIWSATLRRERVLGTAVTVTVDRAAGSCHPQYPDLCYPVNYGYVANITAPDGEEQDAYVLGVSGPVASFTGIVAAVIRRHNDVEEKWVVVPRGTSYTKQEIEEAVRFQEQYFDSEVIL